jgi:hypothetical protein
MEKAGACRLFRFEDHASGAIAKSAMNTSAHKMMIAAACAGESP